MLSKDKLNELFKNYGDLEPREAIKRVTFGTGFTENTVKKYYYEWRKEYMKTKDTREKEETQKKIKESKVEAQSDLSIREIRLKGANGEYRVCKAGIELKNKEHTLAFENEKGWEEFKGEMDKVFSYAKEKNILT